MSGTGSGTVPGTGIGKMGVIISGFSLDSSFDSDNSLPRVFKGQADGGERGRLGEERGDDCDGEGEGEREREMGEFMSVGSDLGVMRGSPEKGLLGRESTRCWSDSFTHDVCEGDGVGLGLGVGGGGGAGVPIVTASNDWSCSMIRIREIRSKCWNTITQGGAAASSAISEDAKAAGGREKEDGDNCKEYRKGRRTY